MLNFLKVKWAGILLAAFLFGFFPIGGDIMALSNREASALYIQSEQVDLKRNLRGAWICTVGNLDWPSAAVARIPNEGERVQKSKQELVTILDKAVELKLNAIFFQVSPAADALYKSDIVPWSKYLTGTFGKDPGFDPLGFVVEECHKRNLEIHAWFNPYRVSLDVKDATKTALNVKKSVYNEHPQWIKTSSDRFVVDPGIPEVRQWARNRVLEVVNKYDIDGVHFDDYFYYESGDGDLKDQETYERYNKGQFSNKGDWRRNNTYLLIKELSAEIRKINPKVKFGISPSGVWGNKKDGHPEGSNTNTSYTNYEKCFADTRRWVLEELIDYIAPQIYFSFANSRAPYGELLNWWSDLCKGRNVHLYIGQGLYKINNDSEAAFKGAEGVREFRRQLQANLAGPQVRGTILFRSLNLFDKDKEAVVDSMKREVWPTIALVPTMPWKGGQAPANPEDGRIQVTSKGVKLSWVDSDKASAYYAIYRFKKGEEGNIDGEQAASKMIGTVRKNRNERQEFTDSSVIQPSEVFYKITSLDRLHHESSGYMLGVSLSKYFPDVPNRFDWAAGAIDRIHEKGIIKGDERGLFQPGLNAKRGDFILMLMEALKLNTSFEQNFEDVKKEDYYYQAIGAAKKLGIVKGDGKDFSPKRPITREDMMVILKNALEVSGLKMEKADEKILSTYQDQNKISSYAREAIATLTKEDIVRGAGNMLDPKRTATRAQIAVVLDRVRGKEE